MTALMTASLFTKRRPIILCDLWLPGCQTATC